MKTMIKCAITKKAINIFPTMSYSFIDTVFNVAIHVIFSPNQLFKDFQGELGQEKLFSLILEVHSESTQTSKMKLFARIVYSF